MSLIKTPVTKHVTAKCPSAKIISESKLVRHRDIAYECDDIATFHQCSGCGYTSSQASNVKTHVNSKCKGCEVLSEKRKLSFEDVPPPTSASQGNVNAVMNVNVSNAPINQTNMFLVITANSKEEYDERLKIFYRVSRENGIEFEKGEFMPSDLLKGFESSNPQLDNTTFTNNSVVCMKTGVKTPVVRYSSQELVRVFDAMLDILEKNEKCDADGVEYDDEFIRNVVNVCIDERTQAGVRYASGKDDFELFRKHLSDILRSDKERTNTKLYTSIYNIAVQTAAKKRLSSLKCPKKPPKRPTTWARTTPTINEIIAGVEPKIPRDQQIYEDYLKDVEQWEDDIKVTREMITDIAAYYRTKTAKRV
jgi:hypothetical protein